ncbi:MAG TPA: hypothetical protein DDY22_19370 [Geobacter sp.]|nr:hypothetical protein [Geobacter sp.]
MTDAERALWRALRSHQMAGLKFRRQHPFGDYIFDFACLQYKLVIEVDGGQHTEQLKHDYDRTHQLMAAGFTVIRFWNNEVLQEIESVKERIWRTVRETQPHPHPDPPLEGEGERQDDPPLEGEGERQDDHPP